ncbi:WYL domain-containing protein [Sulfurimonas sp. HSL1-6]|uniref:helix-turn-helix transcriptional regulator n=1 Tax=Thiomicrolovo immobilis TaxID=3131935 RepID=UPI0031F9D3E5
MKHDYDKILTRLTVILQRLYTGDTLTVSSLAEEFNVSTKTIQRDFNERLIRFPIEKEGRGWKMQEGFRLERSRKPDEELVLDMLETLSGGIGSGFASLASTLLGQLKNHRVSAVDSKTVIEDILGHQHLFVQIETAIEKQRLVSFAYKGKIRIVKPCKIVSFEGYWYLYGEEALSDKLKTFHLKSIEALYIMDDHFECPEEAQSILDRAVNAWFEPENEPFEAILHATAEIAKYFARRPIAPTQRIIQSYENGSIDFSIMVTSERELLHEVKKWVPDLLVRSPRSLALKAREMAQAFAEAQIRMVLE